MLECKYVLGCLLEYFGRLVLGGHTYLNTSVCWVVARVGFDGLASDTGMVCYRKLGVIVSKVGFGGLVSDAGSRCCQG